MSLAGPRPAPCPIGPQLDPVSLTGPRPAPYRSVPSWAHGPAWTPHQRRPIGPQLGTWSSLGHRTTSADRSPAGHMVQPGHRTTSADRSPAGHMVQPGHRTTSGRSVPSNLIGYEQKRTGARSTVSRTDRELRCCRIHRVRVLCIQLNRGIETRVAHRDELNARTRHHYYHGSRYSPIPHGDGFSAPNVLAEFSAFAHTNIAVVRRGPLLTPPVSGHRLRNA